MQDADPAGIRNLRVGERDTIAKDGGLLFFRPRRRQREEDSDRRSGEQGHWVSAFLTGIGC